MNDSKWCRLLNALERVDLRVSFWKFLNDESEYKMPTPTPDQITAYDGKRGIGDHNVCGPFYFRDVETVRWPAEYSRHWLRGLAPVKESQPLNELSTAIDACGVFDYVQDDKGLVLFAYRPA